MRKRLFIIISLIILLHVYIGLQLLQYLPLNYITWIIGILVLAISCGLIPLGMTARFIIKNQRSSDMLTWIGMFDTGLFSSLLILTFIRQIILLIYGLFEKLSLNILTISADAVLILTIFATCIGFINARRTPKVYMIKVPIENLPPALNNFRIAQISDVHVGPTIKYNFVDAIVNTVNSLNVDMIAITGDLVDGSVEELSLHTEPLSKLSSKYGSFFVLGNHEYYSGAESWITEINRLGITVLLNQHVIIKHNETDLVIAGITDFSGEHYDSKHKSNPATAIYGAPDDAIKILLAHQPRSAIIAKEFGFSLQLSGHTHGGQFWPWNLLVKLQQPFVAGLNKMGNMWVYTSRGSGYWGPPKRFGVKSEITLLKLQKG